MNQNNDLMAIRQELQNSVNYSINETMNINRNTANQLAFNIVRGAVLTSEALLEQETTVLAEQLQKIFDTTLENGIQQPKINPITACLQKHENRMQQEKVVDPRVIQQNSTEMKEIENFQALNTSYEELENRSVDHVTHVWMASHGRSDDITLCEAIKNDIHQTIDYLYKPNLSTLTSTIRHNLDQGCYAKYLPSQVVAPTIGEVLPPILDQPLSSQPMNPFCSESLPDNVIK